MRRYLLAALVTLAVAIAWVIVLPEAPIAQPIAFNHARHSGVGCAVCHSGVTSGSRAGIPQGALCLRCHATAPARGVPSAVWTDIAAGRPIAWRQVTQVPPHVNFSHRHHVTGGQLACASCHADIGTRTAPPPRAPVRLVMDTCLSCHRREGASEDCAECHR